MNMYLLLRLTSASKPELVGPTAPTCPIQLFRRRCQRLLLNPKTLRIFKAGNKTCGCPLGKGCELGVLWLNTVLNSCGVASRGCVKLVIERMREVSLDPGFSRKSFPLGNALDDASKIFPCSVLQTNWIRTACEHLRVLTVSMNTCNFQLHQRPGSSA